MKPARMILAVAAVALVAAGCGSSGSDKNEYVRQLNAAVTSLQRSTAELGPGTGAAAATRLEAGGKAMDKAAEDFAAITPPSDAEHAHGQMVDGMHKLADTLRDAAGAARDKDSAKLLETLQGLESSSGAQELAAATKELASKGYNVR